MNAALNGKTVIVTGASGAIGSATARRFAEEGANVVLHYHRNRQSVESLRSELKSVETAIIHADLAKETETRRLFAQVLKQFGRVDTLIANAGSWETSDVPLHKMSLRQWRHTLDNVLTNTFLCMREFMAMVARQKRGNALLIASTAGVFGEPGHADYAAAKSAMAFGLTRSLKNEIARLAPPARNYCGGRVNCICPGWTVAPRNAAKLKDSAVLKRITATMALRKVGQPDDIAHAAVFLSSDKLAGHITGQTLIIAGGMEGRLLWP
jgi:3-oxoacyl-[acyl-carrier protein] reductase